MLSSVPVARYTRSACENAWREREQPVICEAVKRLPQ